MNYNIRVCGNSYSAFEEILKLLMVSAGESDYQVSVYAHKVVTPFSTMVIDIQLIGSAIQEPKELVVDFIDSYKKPDSENDGEVINAMLLDLQFDKGYIYQWGILGAVMSRVSDLSPAFVTSYLLGKGQNKELTLFKKFFN